VAPGSKLVLVCGLFRYYHNVLSDMLKGKGLDIYIPPFTGRSWPAVVYNLKWRTGWQWH